MTNIEIDLWQHYLFDKNDYKQRVNNEIENGNRQGRLRSILTLSYFRKNCQELFLTTLFVFKKLFDI